MKKIFPIRNLKSGDKWRNYSNYLNWTYEKIQGWENYLKLFYPAFEILNESMEVLNIIPEPHTETLYESVIEPAWKYTITSEDSSEEVFCYFPSELYFRQGYLNTHAESYICYFAPPDVHYEVPLQNTVLANGNIQWNKTQTITKTQWNTLVNEGKIEQFPTSRVILSAKWRHFGLQHRGNTDAFNPNNYILIAKPSGAWYTPTSNYNTLVFTLIKKASDAVGAIVPFIVELTPSRYILHSNKEYWEKGFKSMSIYAANWKSSSINPENTFIFFSTEKHKNCLWTSSYPLMHSLLLNEKDSATNANNYEAFFTDDVFTTEIRNVDNHATAVYNINTTNSIDETDTDLWKNIYISVC